MDFELDISSATPSDASRLLKIHIAAVHQTAASSYSQNILDSWSPTSITEKRIENAKKHWIENPENKVLVASVDREVIGFGMIDTSSVLQAVYVHPDYGRMGVGQKLLLALEKEAIGLGLTYLKADASINAEEFYTTNGFSVLEYSTYRLRSGDEMECVKITKRL